ncbi:hypothetical protein K438DRAFT_1759653 [Mycena galopus ATCC 62051]|nr:hypothetical protein K438DRAFT_1759653 [Mycena galopus ATCC 62051]
MKNDPKFAGTVNVAILLSCANDRAGSKYEHRTFFIDRVLLLQREVSNNAARVMGWKQGAHKDPQTTAARVDTAHFKLLVGWCQLPSGQMSGTQMWYTIARYGTYAHRPIICLQVIISLFSLATKDVAEHVLPPGFDLNRYITHVNRGITHFHASFWPIPRTVSDAELEAAEKPLEWELYAGRHHHFLSGLKGGQGVVGRILPDGTRIPMYKIGSGGHFRRCAPGETDTEGPAAFQKPLVDPSRTVRTTPMDGGARPEIRIVRPFGDRGGLHEASLSVASRIRDVTGYSNHPQSDPGLYFLESALLYPKIPLHPVPRLSAGQEIPWRTIRSGPWAFMISIQDGRIESQFLLGWVLFQRRTTLALDAHPPRKTTSPYRKPETPELSVRMR